MDLSVGLVFGALPVLLLGASVGLSHAYNRLSLRHARSERDRDSYLEVLEGSNDALFVINFVNGRIYQANEQAAALLGYTRSSSLRARSSIRIPRNTCTSVRNASPRRGRAKDWSTRTSRSEQRAES
ncbi:MAG: PAS domain-containing protein [Flavobacteriales bacterium]|nr:PAS domain-containing protein [Flavobacteriales bacterium]